MRRIINSLFLPHYSSHSKMCRARRVPPAPACNGDRRIINYRWKSACLRKPYATFTPSDVPAQWLYGWQCPCGMLSVPPAIAKFQLRIRKYNEVSTRQMSYSHRKSTSLLGVPRVTASECTLHSGRPKLHWPILRHAYPIDRRCATICQKASGLDTICAAQSGRGRRNLTAHARRLINTCIGTQHIEGVR